MKHRLGPPGVRLSNNHCAPWGLLQCRVERGGTLCYALWFAQIVQTVRSSQLYSDGICTVRQLVTEMGLVLANQHTGKIHVMPNYPDNFLQGLY